MLVPRVTLNPTSSVYTTGTTKIQNHVNFLSQDKYDPYCDLKVFYHHIYEYKKGIRNLILTTEKTQYKDLIEKRLQKEEIAYHITDIKDDKINVFFGNEDCVKLISTFDKNLSRLTPEQDFMLGILLGYDKIKQCRRYFDMHDTFTKRQSA